MNSFILTEWPDSTPTPVATDNTEAYAASIQKTIERIITARQDFVANRVSPVLTKLEEFSRVADDLDETIADVKNDQIRSAAETVRTIAKADEVSGLFRKMTASIGEFALVQDRLNRDYVSIAVVADNAVATSKLINKIIGIDTEQISFGMALGKLHFIDIPGIGELGGDIETSLTRPITDNADVVVAVINSDETAVSEILREQIRASLSALGDHRSSDTVYVVALREARESDEISQESSEAAIEAVERELFELKDGYASFSSIEIEDKDKVDEFVQSILSKFENDVAELDEMFLDQQLRPLELLFQDAWQSIVELEERLSTQLANGTTDDIDDDRISSRFNEIASVLEVTLHHLEAQENERDDQIADAVRTMAKSLADDQRALLPKLKDIEGVSAIYGGMGAYGYYEKRQRSLLWEYFRIPAAAANDKFQEAKNLLIYALSATTGLKSVLGEEPYSFLTGLYTSFSAYPDSQVAEEIREYRDSLLDQQSVDSILVQVCDIMKHDKAQVDESTSSSIHKALAANLFDSSKTLIDSLTADEGPMLELLKLPNKTAYVRARRLRDALLFTPTSYSHWSAILRQNYRNVWQDDLDNLRQLEDVVDNLKKPFQSLLESGEVHQAQH